jgi:hypothetical protein
MHAKHTLVATAIATLFGSSNLACELACVEDGSGTRCTAKSLKRYDGARPAAQAFNAAPGAPITIDVLYGNVFVTRSTTPQVVVEFTPFAYAAYDNQATADQELAQNLRVAATQQGGINVSVSRLGGSNGLGSDVVVRVPDAFNGAINIVNRAGGPLNHFDVKTDFVGNASAISVQNSASMGSCYVQGAPSVKNTTVQCKNVISVFDVSDMVNITNDKRDHEGGTPAITLRMASVSAAGGGKVYSASGSIAASFPAAGGYTLATRASRGSVKEGTLPGACTKRERGAGDKDIICGAGPNYDIQAGHAPTGPVREANVDLSFR